MFTVLFHVVPANDTPDPALFRIWVPSRSRSSLEVAAAELAPVVAPLGTSHHRASSTKGRFTTLNNVSGPTMTFAKPPSGRSPYQNTLPLVGPPTNRA